MTVCQSVVDLLKCRRMPALYVVIAGSLLSGCGGLVSSVTGDYAGSLSSAMLNQEDPELVREALPAYLMMLDSLIASNPDSETILSAGAKLYAVYGAALVDDPARAAILTNRGREYGERALCAADDNACNLDGLSYDSYAEVIRAVDEDAVDALYSYSLSSLAWIRANSGDYKALAGLPKIEVALDQVMQLEPGDLAASTAMYLGILNTLRPPALGGNPELGRDWFRQGIELSGGRDLSIKVEYARGYARLLYDRELHDRLLNEVLIAEVKQPDLTMFNLLAQEQATSLLASADDYF